MLMTCRSVCAISCIMSAIFSATLPLTPVSISSKIIVGSFTAPLIIAFSDSMTLAISPPDATCATGCICVLVFALKRNDAVSCPSVPSSFFSSLTAKRTLGMPSCISLSGISRSISLAAFVRTAVSLSARAAHSSASRFSRSSIAAISSSPLSILSNFDSSSDLISSSSSTVATLCFFSSE